MQNENTTKNRLAEMDFGLDNINSYLLRYLRSISKFVIMARKPKIYQSQDILDMFKKLSNPEKVSVLIKSLDHMQSYNGRSKTQCIAMGMGYSPSGLGDYSKDL